MGYVSARSEPCTTVVLAWETPAPKRARKNTNTLMANPVAATMIPNAMVAHPMMGARRNRSASHPMGTMPKTRNPPEIPITKTMALVLTWNED